MNRRYDIFRFDVEASARFARDVLERARVTGAVIGTVGAWPTLRPEEQLHTKDIDLAVREEDSVWIEKTLNEMGIPFGRTEFGGISVELPGQGVKVDFIDRRIELAPLCREAVEAAALAGDTIQIGEVVLSHVPVEYVVAMKMFPARPKDDRTIEALLAASGLDYARARDVVRRHLGPASANRLDAMARAAGRAVPRDAPSGE